MTSKPESVVTVAVSSAGGPIRLQIGKGAMLRLWITQPRTLRCEHGALWLTEEGVFDDLTLTDGQSARLVHKGKAVLLAVADSIVAVESASASSAIVAPWSLAGMQGRMTAALGIWQ